MTPGQLALLTRGEAALNGNGKTEPVRPPETDADDLVAFAAATS